MSLLVIARPGFAESSLVLPRPLVFGEIPAATYDQGGQLVGEARMRIERLPNGNVRMESMSGIDGSAEISVMAELAPLGDGHQLRLLEQRSQSLDEQGQSLGVMTIDHQRGIAVCGAPPGSGAEGQQIQLPENDRVANVPINLLLLPLATGEASEVEFQMLLCRMGARIINARAVVRNNGHAEDGPIEVRYDVDFGPVLSRLAAPFMPKLSVWFDAGSPGTWIGHRMPLFSRGPTVLVVRSGVSPSLLGVGR